MQSLPIQATFFRRVQACGTLAGASLILVNPGLYRQAAQKVSARPLRESAFQTEVLPGSSGRRSDTSCRRLRFQDGFRSGLESRFRSRLLTATVTGAKLRAVLHFSL